MKNYLAPMIDTYVVSAEGGFALSNNFEQPGYGGEDNL